MHTLRILLGAAFMLAANTETGLAQSNSLRVGANGVAASAGGSVAGQTYRARSGQSHEVILPDGTSVVVGAGGSFRVERFSWNGQGGSGTLRLSPGTYRISSGALGRGGNLTVFAGNTQIVIEGATAVVSLDQENTVTSYMTVGGRVTLSAQGRCARRLSRSGFATQARSGACPERATRVAAARLLQDRRALRPTRRVAAGAVATGEARSSGRILVPAASSNAITTEDAQQTNAPDAVEEIINDQTSTPATPGIQFALNLAPGIDVPGAASPNVTGSPVTSTDGRFAIFDVGLIETPPELPDTITEAIGPPIFESRAGNLYFSNSDLQPVSNTGNTTGDFSEAFRFVNTISKLVLGPGETSDFVTIEEAIAQEKAGLPGDVVDFYLTELSEPDDPFSFITLDLDAAGLSTSTELGEELSIEYTPLPVNGSTFEVLDFPYDNKVAAGFTRANGVLEAGPETIFTVSEGFVLYHTTDALDGMPDPDGQSEIFATGTTDGASKAYFDFRVERYASTFGLFDLLKDGEEPWPGYRPKRSLLPDNSRQTGANATDRIALNETGIYFVYAPQKTDDPLGDIAQVIQADLGFNGAGGEQSSTLSIATGSVLRDQIERTDEFGNSFEVPDYALDLHSLGSLRNSSKGVGSIFVSSPLTTLAFGGENENLPSDGLAGYYLLASASAAAGSAFLPVNPKASVATFQTVRFLRATGQAGASGTTFGSGPLPDFEPDGRTVTPALSGYAAGLAEIQLSSNSLAVESRGASSTGMPNFTLSLDSETNRTRASMSLASPEGTIVTIVMGGNEAAQAQLSAYIDQSKFGARTEIGSDGLGFAMASSALVLGEPVEDGGKTSRPVTGLGSGAGTMVQDYDHVKWGVFLGDRIAEAGPKLREHLHIGTWVAGDPVDVSKYTDFTGTAVYAGHVIGNAFDGESVYTAIGKFTNTWEFGGGKDAGTVEMTFDNATYAGSTALKSGGGFESTDLAAPGRTGSLNGEFFGGVSTAGTNTAPNALGGQFDVSNTAGAPTYQASGTFAAEKQ